MYPTSISYFLLQFGVVFCHPLLQNLVFHISFYNSVFSFCNLIFVFSFCNYVGISSSLFSFCNLIFCFLLFLHSSSLWLLIMATERDGSLQSVSVRLDGKNYSSWSYVMINFLKGKKIWRYVSGTYVVPKNTEEEDAALIDVWEANNA
jgi:hypothetical protein